MLKSISPIVTVTSAVANFLLLYGCSSPLPWPESPLYETPTNDPMCVTARANGDPLHTN